jgi:hypothetical protein
MHTFSLQRDATLQHTKKKFSGDPLLWVSSVIFVDALGALW